MTRRGALVGVLAAAVLVVGGMPAHAAPLEENAGSRVIGRSVDDRPIVARHLGSPDAPVQLVVIGQLHGNEPGGRRVVERLSRSSIPDGVGLWLLTSVNPDGARAGTRMNARRVDLNRNFPDDWRRAGRGTDQWSGSRAASEPETRAVMRFLLREQPTAVLGYHQAYDVVDISHRRSRPAGRQLARWMGEQARVVGCTGPCHGTMTQWVDAELKAVALTVELDRRVSGAEADRAAAAVLRLGQWLGR
jgi:succinylglutamate desuccinylase